MFGSFVFAVGAPSRVRSPTVGYQAPTVTTTSRRSPHRVMLPGMADPSWSKHVADILRRNDIRTFATVPDYIVSHVLEQLWADPDCRVVTVTREEEGVGLLSGAWLAGRRGALLMQNR